MYGMAAYFVRQKEFQKLDFKRSSHLERGGCKKHQIRACNYWRGNFKEAKARVEEEEEEEEEEGIRDSFSLLNDVEVPFLPTFQ